MVNQFMLPMPTLLNVTNFLDIHMLFHLQHLHIDHIVLFTNLIGKILC